VLYECINAKTTPSFRRPIDKPLFFPLLPAQA